MDGARGQCTHLLVKGAAQFETLGESGNAGLQLGMGKMIQPAKKTEIIFSCETSEEALVGTGVVAQVTPDRSGFTSRIESGDDGRSARGEKQRGEYAKQRRLAGTVGPQQSDSFACPNLQ